jgi:nicotinamidase/pyrazinamidase
MYSKIKLLVMATAIVTASKPLIAQSTGKTALLVIDVQENLLKPNSRLHMDTASIPSFLHSLNDAIRYFNSNDIPVLYTVNEWTNPVLNMLTGNVCKKGTPGTGIDKNVYRVNDTIYRKSKMSALSNKELLNYLREHSIAHLYIAGLFAEACIKGTAREAMKKGYNVTVIEDATGSKTDSKKAKSMKVCKAAGARLIKVDQLEIVYTNK